MKAAILLIGCAALLSVACAKSESNSNSPPSKPLRGEFSGCASVRAGPVCEIPSDNKLRVWVATDSALHAYVDERAIALSPNEAIDGGVLLRIHVDENARGLRLVADDGRVFSLTLASRVPRPWVDEIKKLRQKGDVENAIRLAEQAIRSEKPDDRALGTGWLGRLELGRGNATKATRAFADAAAQHRQLGRISDAVDDNLALAFALHQRESRYDEARKVLDEARQDARDYPDGRAREPYYRGLLAIETGDHRTAIADLAESRKRAERVGLDKVARNSRLAQAIELEAVGRYKDAAQTLSDILQTASFRDAAPCEVAEWSNTAGYVHLAWAMREDENASAIRDATAFLERADNAVRPDAPDAEKCADPHIRTSIVGNAVLLAIQTNDLSTAQTKLKIARSVTDHPRGVEVLFWHDLDALIALRSNQLARAYSEFDTEDRLATAALRGEERWRALVGKALVLEKQGRSRDALAAYTKADALANDQATRVPMHQGRGGFLGGRDRAARLKLDLLVKLKKPREAFDLARATTTQLLRQLAQATQIQMLGGEGKAAWDRALARYQQQRAELDRQSEDDWKLSRKELDERTAKRKATQETLRTLLDEAFKVVDAPEPPLSTMTPSAGELYLGFAHGNEMLHVFALDAGGIASAAVQVRANARFLDGLRMLAPSLLAKIRDAKQVHLSVPDELGNIDFHALEFDGIPLIRRVPTDYWFDLGASAFAREQWSKQQSTSPVIVADPTSDLPLAREEMVGVRRALEARGLRVTSLTGKQATRAAVVEAIAGPSVETIAEPVAEPLQPADFLHLAGHGRYGGSEGWESAIALADGSSLLVGDILTMRRIPRKVLLSGCEMAKTSNSQRISTLGLAQAFLIAGSEWVVAPTRPVSDEVALSVARRLYPRIVDENPSHVLRDILLDAMRDDPSADWAAYRVLRR